jgi:hypothetical protein
MKGPEDTASVNTSPAVQKAVGVADTVESTKSGSSWTRWFRWGSSKSAQDDSSKK